MGNETTLGGSKKNVPTRAELDHCIKTVIGAVGICGLLRLAHEYFRLSPNHSGYRSYDAIPPVMLIAEGMVRSATEELDEDWDDAVNDEFEVERFTQYELLLHQLSKGN